MKDIQRISTAPSREEVRTDFVETKDAGTVLLAPLFFGCERRSNFLPGEYLHHDGLIEILKEKGAVTLPHIGGHFNQAVREGRKVGVKEWREKAGRSEGVTTFIVQ